MPRDPIPEELRRYILTSVPSVPFLEALLLFRGAQGAPMTTELVARRLYLSEHAARHVVSQLRDSRIVLQEAAGDSHRFAPETVELAGILDLLAEFYRTNLVEVTDLIHDRAGRKAQQFAAAFKLRKNS